MLSVRPRLENGRFFHGEHALHPVGFNYWPSNTGTDCWKDFNLAEWEEDFAEMRQRGFDTVRTFLLWPDFQPEENRIDMEKIRLFRQTVDLAAAQDLWVIPTVFQGWMSGTNFDPHWRKDRHLLKDQVLRQAMLRLFREVCISLEDASNILAIDFANEIDVICQDVDAACVRSWTAELRDTANKILPGLAVTNGTALNPMRATSKWHFADQAVDFQCMHGYPMFWTPLSVTSMRTARSSLVFGSMTSFAAAYGPVMREEYGTAVGGDSTLIGGFVGASTFASWLAGANGFLYWCWRDFKTKKFPYLKDPMESSLGYVDTTLNSKQWSPALDNFLEFYKEHAAWHPVPDPVGIYIPKQFKGQGEEADEAMASAYENLVANGCLPRFTEHIDCTLELLVLPLTHLTINEIETLEAFCRQGGKVIALGVTSTTCSRYWEALTSTRQVDVFRSSLPEMLLRGPDGVSTLDMPVDNLRKAPWPVLEASTEEVTSWGQDTSFPYGFTSTCGKGKIVQFIPPLNSSQNSDIDPTHAQFWASLLRETGWTSCWDVKPLGIQVGEMVDLSGKRKLLLINHTNSACTARVEKSGVVLHCALSGKESVYLPLDKR